MLHDFKEAPQNIFVFSCWDYHGWDYHGNANALILTSTPFIGMLFIFCVIRLVLASHGRTGHKHTGYVKFIGFVDGNNEDVYIGLRLDDESKFHFYIQWIDIYIQWIQFHYQSIQSFYFILIQSIGNCRR